MRKGAKRILGALISLVMVVSVLTAVVFATGETTDISDVLEGWSITLSDDISVKFDLNSAGYDVAVTVNGAAVTPTISGDVVTVNVAAAQMTDTIVLKVDNGETVYTDEYSVREYAEIILTGEYDGYVKDMVKQMLNYGAAAQTYFDYNTKNLANAGYELENNTVELPEAPATTVVDNLDGIKLYGTSLVLESKTAVRFYFEVDDGYDITDFTFSQGKLGMKHGMHFVEIDGINPQDLSKEITLSANNGAWSITYSPMNYIVRMSNKEGSSDSMKSLVQALYSYHQEAVHYDSVVPVGALQSSVYPWGPGGIYATMPENDAYFVQDDWGVEYTPVSADVIKLVRDGVTTSVGMPGQGTLIKFTATNYYLKTENHTISGEVLPLRDQDYLIIDGRFQHPATGNVMYISKTYIYNNNGTLEFSTTEPVPETIYEVGVLSAHTAGGSGTGFYATGLENDAPYSDWAAEYAPTSKECIQIIRNGETIYRTNTGAGAIIKLGGTGYFVKFDTWIDSTNYPLQAGDIIIIEGIFVGTGNYAEAEGVKIKIDKTYVVYDGSSFTFSATEPGTTTVVSGGNMTSGDEWDVDGNIFFTMAKNAIPEDADMAFEYTADAGVIKLVRGESTFELTGTIIKYDATGYYMVLSGDALPLQKNDYLIVEGDFANADNGYTLNIAKTYILVDGDNLVYSTTEPVIANKYDVGVLKAHNAGHYDTGIYFSTAEVNDAPYGANGAWDTYYDARSIDNIKLIRNGETVSIGLTDRNTICKFGANDYVLRLENWTIGDYAPYTTNDVFIVEGEFIHKNSNTILNIEKTYIYYNGSAWVFSAVLPVTYDVGVLKAHNAGHYDTGIYFSTAEVNDAPYGANGAWDTYYDARSIDNIKLIRNGETVSIGLTDRNTICKFGANDYVLRLENWTIGDYAPYTTNDVFIVEGEFIHKNSDTILNIEKTYIYYNGSAWVFAASLPTTVNAGVLQTHEAGMSGNGIYFRTAANDAPYNNDWSLEYTQTSADNIKLIRNGVTTSVGIAGRPMFVRINETDHYLKLENWTIGDYAPITTDDMLIIEGAFSYAAEGVTLNITKSYIYYDGAAWVCSGEEPSTIPSTGVLTAHSAGGSNTAFYATGAANDAPYDWAAEYAPSTADCIKLIRNGVTYSTASVGAGTVVKFDATGYYIKFESWMNGNYPLQAGDIIIIEGVFVGTGNYAAAEGVKIKIDKTYVVYDGSSFTFSATEPSTVPSAGVLTAHSAGGSNTAFYATGAANAAPYDWAAEYAPSTADCIKLIRNGVTYSTAPVGAGTVVKFDTTGYYIKFESWMNGNYPLQAGDIIIIEGVFVGTGNYAAAEGVELKIDKTFVSYNGTSFTFSESDPRVINVGTMYAQGGTNWSGNGINFAVDADNLPYNADWSVEYKPVSADAIKLIRNGQTKNIANTGAGTIVKMGEDNCYLKLEQWMIGDVYPITDGDVLVVEGEFKHGDYTMVIEKTYIVIGSKDNDEVTFTTHYAETDFGTVILPTSTEDMTIGMWNGSHHVFDHKQLQELQAAGITKIMGVNPLWIGTDNVNAWLDRVYSYGISVIFDLREWDGTADYKWTYEGQETAFTLKDLYNHEAIIGFLMYDEPGADVFDDLKTLKAQFDDVMPEGKLFYVNLFPECAANSSLGTESSWWESIFGNEKDYDTDYVTAFLNTVGIEVLSWDNYPLITNSSNKEGIRTDYFHNFEVMASKNKPLWYTMLSAGHTAGASDTYYATPTAEELRWQMAVAMTYGVQNIDHYIYASHEDDYSCMVEYETWNPTALYYDILTVDNEYLAWDNIFMAYKWQGVGVYDTGSTNKMLSTLENKLNLANYGLTVTSSNEDLLVGVFDHDGEKAYMVTNAGSAGSTNVGDGKNFTTADATVTLNLGSGSYKCVAVIDNGEISYVAVNNNTVTLNVQAYEGVFVIPVLN